MISLFGEASDRLCQKLDTAASTGEEVEMESLFSRLTLDIIGKAVFNYDFDSLTNDTGVIEVPTLLCFQFCYLWINENESFFCVTLLFRQFTLF